MNRTVEMYADGYEFNEIIEELNCSDENILQEINIFKEEARIYRGKKSSTFNADFKELLVNRYQSGYSIYSISKDFSLSTSTVHKYLKQAGIDTKKADNKKYDVLNWDRFEVCPTCNSTRSVRNIGLHNQEEAHGEKPTHSFCSSCNTEWYKEGSEIRKVRWYAVN